MSSIFRDPEGKIILMCKGADSAIASRLGQTEYIDSVTGDFVPQSLTTENKEILSSTSHHVDNFAKEGLRTLYLAERVIKEEDFQKWIVKKNEAKLATKDRENVVAAVDELIETELELIGSTAIEDRL